MKRNKLNKHIRYLQRIRRLSGTNNHNFIHQLHCRIIRYHSFLGTTYKTKEGQESYEQRILRAHPELKPYLDLPTT